METTVDKPTLAIYQQLNPAQQQLLELISLIYIYINLDTLHKCLKQTNLKSLSGYRSSQVTLSKTLQLLVSLDLLVENKATYSCNKQIIHQVTLRAISNTYADWYIRAINTSFQPTRYSRHQPKISDKDKSIQHVRIALYANQTSNCHDEFLQLVCHACFFSPQVDIDWLLSRKIKYQQCLVEAYSNFAYVTGQVSDSLRQMFHYYENHFVTLNNNHLSYAVIRYFIYTGHLNKAHALLNKFTNQRSSSYCANLATLYFLTGQTKPAYECFSLAYDLLKKETKKHRALFGHGIDNFYVLSLFHQGTDKSMKEATRYLQTLRPEDPQSYSMMNHRPLYAIHALLNDNVLIVESFTADIKSNLKAADALEHSFAALAHYWTDREKLQHHQQILEQCFNRCQHTLVFPAFIYADILEKISPNKQIYTDYLQQQTTTPFMRFTQLLDVIPTWERALNNLTNIITQKEENTQSNKRLAWLINLDDYSITVAEQKRSANGSWSKGRKMSIDRLLYADLDYLSSADKRVIGVLDEAYDYYDDEEEEELDTYKINLALIGHPHIYDANSPNTQLEFVRGEVELNIEQKEKNFHLQLSHTADTPCVCFERESRTRYRIVNISPQICQVSTIFGDQGITVPPQAKEKIIDVVKSISPHMVINSNVAEMNTPSIAGKSDLIVHLTPQGSDLSVEALVRPFDEKGPFYPAGEGQSYVTLYDETQPLRAQRNLSQEKSNLAKLISHCPSLSADSDDRALTQNQWLMDEPESCLNVLTDLKDNPTLCQVEWPDGQRLRVTSSHSFNDMSLSVRRENNWFSVDGELKIDDHTVLSMRALLELLANSRGRYIPLDDGRFLALTDQFRDQLKQLKAITQSDQSGIHINPLGALALEELVQDAQLEYDSDWLQNIERIKKAKKFNPRLPSKLNATLRDYQIDGFKWLSRLAHWGAGACLADDMGLGKTIQTIAVLQQKASKGPSLVIAPTSVCHNWQEECRQFAPKLETYILSESSDRKYLIESAKKNEIIISSYGLLQTQIKHLKEINWQVIVLDEAQAIKNKTTKRAKAAMQLQGEFKVALTGTPIENHLGEIWSLFHFLNPGLLGSLNSFQERFAIPIERNNEEHASQALKQILQPFILRRTKDKVLKELPARTETTMTIEMDKDESAFYEALRQQAVDNISNMNSKTKGQHRINILAEITRLRRACCSPALINQDIPVQSCKLKAFSRLVSDILENEHKILVFSQFVGYLDMVRQLLDDMKIHYQYLDGSTPAKARKQRVNAFQSGEGDVFLISLKAGGTGLNLTAADYVIHLDPWWNPAVEDQASDRAHRIGQQRPVTIYRLIMQDSIEEKIISLHKEKRDLAADLLSGTHKISKLDENELMELICE